MDSFSSLFHFIRLFWNHILICVSVRAKLDAISMRRVRVKYLLKWNSFSSSTSCRWVKVNLFFWLTAVWLFISGLVSSFSETLTVPAVRRHEKEKENRWTKKPCYLWYTNNWFQIRPLGLRKVSFWNHRCIKPNRNWFASIRSFRLLNTFIYTCLLNIVKGFSLKCRSVRNGNVFPRPYFVFSVCFNYRWKGQELMAKLDSVFNIQWGHNV